MFEHLIYPKMGLKGNVDLCLSQIGINGNSIPPLELRTRPAVTWVLIFSRFNVILVLLRGILNVFFIGVSDFSPLLLATFFLPFHKEQVILAFKGDKLLESCHRKNSKLIPIDPFELIFSDQW